MQYVFSQEEMDELNGKQESLERLPSIKDLQEFCSFVSDNLILTSGWAKGRVWGCILTRSKDNYCDDCPARKVCPNPNKEFSK